eukprot:1219880-Prymnesium_polylepis.1
MLTGWGDATSRDATGVDRGDVVTLTGASRAKPLRTDTDYPPSELGTKGPQNRRDINAHLRPNELLRSHSPISGRHSPEQSSRGEECQTSTRDQVEQPDGR